MNILLIIKWSDVDVMRLSLCLGAWWPGGGSSSSVSQFLPSCSGSACQMAVKWRDGYRGDLSPWLFWPLCFCSVWGRCPAEREEQTLRCAQLSARLSAGICSPDLWRYYNTLRCQYTYYGPWIESFQDCWWDPEFPQLSQMVQSLPGFLNLCLNVCSPSQVLWDVYTEVLEATHPLHRGPTDHKSVGPLLSLPEVHNQLFSFAYIQRGTHRGLLYFIQVCGLIVIGNEAQNHSIIGEFDDRSGAVRGHAVVCVERVEQGTQDTTLSGSYVKSHTFTFDFFIKNILSFHFHIEMFNMM